MCGTTGEGITLNQEERRLIIRAAKDEATRPVIVATGDASLGAALEKTLEAEKMGADGALVITPYYNCPSQEGLCHYFEKIAEATSLPLLIYHHPKRTGVSLTFESLKRLSKIKNIVGIKEASGDVSFAMRIIHHIPDWAVFAGDDLMTLPFLAVGAKGGISVLANLLPSKIKTLIDKQDRKVFQEVFSIYRRGSMRGQSCSD